MITEVYKPINKVRIVTAAALFDGHDASINIMRRLIQATGCEVIHLGHDRSAEEVVDTAIQEDANAIALTSYQGGHNEYFKYMYDLLKEKGASHIKIFGGGGGTILPEEIEALQNYGITRIYHPDDGRFMGLQGMINDLVERSDFPLGEHLNQEPNNLSIHNKTDIARVISAAENFSDENKTILENLRSKAKSIHSPVLGITGTGGAGKSSLVDELVRRFLLDFADKTIAIISVDPSKRKTGGALLGDRIRMNAIRNPRVYMRSLATRQANLALSKHIDDAVSILKVSGYDLIVLETSGIGQSDTEIADHSDLSLYVMTPEYGAASQLEKIDMLDFADVIAINKFDKRGALDALRDVKKQFQRNHQLFDKNVDSMPVFGTIASQFNDPGMNSLYRAIMDALVEKGGFPEKSTFAFSGEMSEKIFIIPPSRTRYLAEISEDNHKYNQWVIEQSAIGQKLYALQTSIETLKQSKLEDKDRLVKGLEETFETLSLDFDLKNKKAIEEWPKKVELYKNPEYKFKVRGKELTILTHTESLSHTQVPKIAIPKYEAWGDRLKWQLQENVPGEFPYTPLVCILSNAKEKTQLGCLPEKVDQNEPTRRFHYVSMGIARQTAFNCL
jgi:methylmalonyl-CoA mutase